VVDSRETVTGSAAIFIAQAPRNDAIDSQRAGLADPTKNVGPTTLDNMMGFEFHGRILSDLAKPIIIDHVARVVDE